MPLLTCAAKLSDCGLYRYQLERMWAFGPALTFVMLNPSTADAQGDDPTVRRCVHFAKASRHAGIRVVNLFAFRATSPGTLALVPDPVGPENDTHLKAAAVYDGGAIVCAWGAGGAAAGMLASRAKEVENMLLGLPGVRALYCLGTTKHGQPKHPLYLPNHTPLALYKGTLPTPSKRGLDGAARA